MSKSKKLEVPFNNKAYKRICEENRQLCEDKHQDYGPDNISTFGLEGLTMRIWEKTQRLHNIIWKKRNPVIKDENVDNVLRDIANYCIIAMMLKNKEWY